MHSDVMWRWCDAARRKLFANLSPALSCSQRLTNCPWCLAYFARCLCNTLPSESRCTWRVTSLASSWRSKSNSKWQYKVKKTKKEKRILLTWVFVFQNLKLDTKWWMDSCWSLAFYKHWRGLHNLWLQRAPMGGQSSCGQTSCKPGP